jgi:hypothetical protein
MSDLKLAIEGNVGRLKSTFAQSASAISGRAAIPASCYDLWQRRANLHAPLEATLELLPMRELAWNVLTSVASDENVVDGEANTVRFCGQEISFATARHLALTGYLTTSWLVYDRLSNVCGRLVGHESIGNNPQPTSNPKLIEHFVRENKDKYRQHGFSLACLLPPAYGWPASVSYVLRNWLVHEGLEAEGIPLFNGNALADSFELSDAAIKRIEDVCSTNGAEHSHCCLSSDADHPWYDKTILTILEKYHSEIDEMFCCLLKWAVTSFTGQADAFSARDRSAPSIPTSPAASTSSAGEQSND